MKDYVVVLGSGMSINDLSEEEREFIDSCKVKIAVNKFAAFYKKAGIKPTHVFYTDDYYEASRKFFEYMIQKLYKERTPNLTFIVSKSMFPMLALSQWHFIEKKLKRFYKELISALLKKRFLLHVDKHLKLPVKKRDFSQLKIMRLPSDSIIQSIEIVSHIKKGTSWAKSLQEPLYHFKGSLSTVFNHISIFYPYKKVFLVGVDFNTSNYFFEEELNKLNFETKDWTYDLIKKKNKHYSIITTNGVKMDDEIPFMISELKKRNIELYNINKNSYLVEEGFVKYIDLNKIIK